MFATRLLSSVMLVVALPLLGHLRAAEPTPRLVQVSGRGLVRAIPDEVAVCMTITTVDDDLLRVRSDSDDQARTVLNLARQHGVTEDGFEVSRLDLLLEYSEQLRRQVYQVERDLEIRLHQLANLDGLLSDLLTVPSSTITEVTFNTTKAREHRLEALRRAVADAREKAELLAELNGLTLGKAREIQINVEFHSPFVASVVPVVGSAHDQPRSGVVENSRQTELRGQEQGVSSSSLPAWLVAFSTPADRPAQPAEATGQTALFGLGLIDISASLDIDFELDE